MDTLQNVIKQYLDDTGLSISAFSRKCDISKAYMSMLIRNKDSRGNPIKPSIETLEKIAYGMGMPFEGFFSRLRGDTEIIVNSSSSASGLDDQDSSSGYYTNPETAKVAQEIFDNKELRVLFDAARDASPEDLKTATDVLNALLAKERGSNDNEEA